MPPKRKPPPTTTISVYKLQKLQRETKGKNNKKSINTKTDEGPQSLLKSNRSPGRPRRSQISDQTIKETAKTSQPGPEKTRKGRHVQWVRPQNEGEEDDEDMPEGFARVLFGRRYSELQNNQETRLEPSPIPSPTFRGQGRDVANTQRRFRATLRLNESAPYLHSLHNDIQRHISKVTIEIDRQTLLEENLEGLSRNSAVIAYRERSIKGSCVGGSIDEDFRVTALSKDPFRTTKGEGKVTHFDLLRVTPTDFSDRAVPGYFIYLPPDTTITVNGQTFTNESRREAPEDFWIGPLKSFTVIELIGQPLFFWRKSDDIRYDTPGRIPSYGERQLRRQHAYTNTNATSLSVQVLEAREVVGVQDVRTENRLAGAKLAGNEEIGTKNSEEEETGARGTSRYGVPNQQLSSSGSSSEAACTRSAFPPPRKKQKSLSPKQTQRTPSTQQPRKASSQMQAQKTLSLGPPTTPTSPCQKQAEHMRVQLSTAGISTDGLTDRQVFKRYRKEFGAKERERFAEINKNHCLYFRQQLKEYKHIMRRVGEEGAQIPIARMRNDFGTDQDDRDVMLAIASVIEAIVDHQKDDKNLGGFALLDPDTLHAARTSTPSGRMVAGARRVWIFPYTITPEQILDIKGTKFVKDRKALADELQDIPQGHTILAVIQEERTTYRDGERRPEFVIYFVDSWPNYMEGDYGGIAGELQRIARNVGWTSHRNPDDHVKFSHECWLAETVAYQKEDWTSGLHAVINAWICALGLTFNTEVKLELDNEFYSHVWSLIHCAMASVMDWSTIASFLMCYRLVRERKIQAVPRDRRFLYTRHQVNESTLRDRIGNLIALDNISAIKYPDYRQHPYDFRNNVHFEEWLNRRDSRSRYYDSTDEVAEDFEDEFSRPGLLDGSAPCDYFRRSKERLFEDKRISTWLAEFKSSVDLTTELGQWLLEEEVLLAIASVTLGITEVQSERDGFSILPNFEVQFCAMPENDEPLEPAIRFGRPMIVSLNHNHHIVLLVLQLNQQQNPIISVVDSRDWHHDMQDRTQIYGTALAMLRRSKWWRNVFRSSDSFPKVEEAIWIRGAQQPNNWACGYYVILNAWALAMGLELNLEFRPKKSFFQDAQDIIHLARGGFAGWKLIYAFLLCTQFVIQKSRVPKSRRFPQTLRLLNGNELIDELERLREAEVDFWRSTTRSDLDDLGQQSSIRLPEGRAHDDRFRSDSWTMTTKTQTAEDLIK
ncbi:hypothetical protein K469DRAFT_293911 [Zopfia rhizophila CBS 207.26]|uniref:Ubiquitin-like protease family profile domain-containing protein n=1 Tax=Zopfia rhizophila CBS 207.26 TaxID=1314779 RepID=A0A6A6DNV6_9PEZI|nr:hypothetical protein K469DRAFT_293911 [Zopfia rhizophila CBS 207.26]